jgi:hypothetical protein
MNRSTLDSGFDIHGDGLDVSKTWVDAYITISPLTDTPTVGTDEVLTISVYTDDGSGSGFVLADGVPITASLHNTGGATADFNPTGTGTCTTSGGTCTVTINSPAAGNTAVNAEFSGLSVGGAALSRATGDSLSQDSTDASIDWLPHP